MGTIEQRLDAIRKIQDQHERAEAIKNLLRDNPRRFFTDKELGQDRYLHNDFIRKAFSGESFQKDGFSRTEHDKNTSNRHDVFFYNDLMDYAKKLLKDNPNKGFHPDLEKDYFLFCAMNQTVRFNGEDGFSQIGQELYYRDLKGRMSSFLQKNPGKFFSETKLKTELFVKTIEEDDSFRDTFESLAREDKGFRKTDEGGKRIYYYMKH